MNVNVNVTQAIWVVRGEEPVQGTKVFLVSSHETVTSHEPVTKQYKFLLEYKERNIEEGCGREREEG